MKFLKQLTVIILALSMLLCGASCSLLSDTPTSNTPTSSTEAETKEPPKIEINVGSGDKLPDIQDMQFIYDPTEMFSVGSDFTVVLAEQ